MSRNVIGCLIAAALLVAALPGRAAPAPSIDFKLTQDPAVRQGVLPNGLRYAVMRNPTPVGGASARLALGVGSYDEEESERGAAHFVEHMAFRSSSGFANGMLEDRFGLLGVSIGRDQNAFTSLNSTIYTVDLPDRRPEGLARVLDWMRSAADGILFDPRQVELERGVVLAEKSASSSTTSELGERLREFQAQGLRSGNRRPIGTDASLRAMTPARLKGFYDRWYRPEHAVVVVVGDAPVNELEASVKRAFSSWTAKGPAPKRATPNGVPQRGLDALTQADPRLPSTITTCRFAAPVPRQDNVFARVRSELLGKLWTDIYDKRMARHANTAGNTLLSAEAGVQDDVRDSRRTCLFVMPTDGNWKQSLEVSQKELRRLAADGPSDTELETAIEALRAVLRGGVSQARTRHSRDLATSFASLLLDEDPILDPAQLMRAYDIAADGLTPDDIKAAIARDWTGTGPLITATGPDVPGRDTLLAAWRANDAAAPLARYAESTAVAWAYDDFGKPGRVVERTPFANGDFVRIRFENGTMLYHKRTKFEANTAEIAVVLGNGQRDFTRSEQLAAAMAAGLFAYGGTGKMSYEDLEATVGNSTNGVQVTLSPHALLLSGRTIADQMAVQAKLMAAYVADPGFRPEIAEKIPTAANMMIQMIRSDPAAMASVALSKSLFPDDPDLEALASYRNADFIRVLKPVLTRSRIGLAIVGDISEAEATVAVAASFGALPNRTTAPAPPDALQFRQFPDSAPPPVTATHDGPAEKAAAIMIWPLFVANETRRHEELTLRILERIFETKLRHTIRGELGKTYSPAIETELVDNADQGGMQVAIETSPKDLAELVAATRQLAEQLASGEITQADIDQAREPMIARNRLSRSTNPAWVATLAMASRYPYALADLTEYEAMIGRVSLDDVRKASARWLARAPIVATAVPKGAGK